MKTNKLLKYAFSQPLVFKICGLHLGHSLTPVLPWFQLPFSPTIIQAEVEQLLGPCHPLILSVTLLQDIMYRGAPTTPPPSYLHSQLWTPELRGKAICRSLLIGVSAKPSTEKCFWQLLSFINNPLLGWVAQTWYFKSIYTKHMNQISHLFYFTWGGEEVKRYCHSQFKDLMVENASECPCLSHLASGFFFPKILLKGGFPIFCKDCACST